MNINSDELTTVSQDNSDEAGILEIAEVGNKVGGQCASFSLTLSVSMVEVRSKSAGEKVVDFQVEEFDAERGRERIETVLRSRNYSTNVWHGTCSNQNYQGMRGVILDFDSGMAIEEARKAFAEYNHIIHTSSSHQVLKNEMMADRFRVILPFAPGEVRFASQSEARGVYRRLLNTYSQADPSCKEPGRKYFPHSAEKGAPFECFVNSTGRYIEIEPEAVDDPVECDTLFVARGSHELHPQRELERMLKFDPFVKWCIERAQEGIPEPLWYAMISNLCRFEGGAEVIHEISARDQTPGRYSVSGTDWKIEHALDASGPLTYEKIVRDGWPGGVPLKPRSPAGWGVIGKIRDRLGYGEKGEKRLFAQDEVIIGIDGQWRITEVREFRHDPPAGHSKVPAVCPFCDHDTASLIADSFGFVQLDCPECKQVYHEYAVHPEMFSYQGELYRVEMRSDKFVSMECLKSDHFRNKDDYDYAKKKLLTDPKRRFLDDDFQIRRVGSVDFPCLDYELRVEDNALVFKYPALPIDVADNDFVDAFLGGMFGSYSGFIKDWMAMYCFTNYVTLPVIVLTGSRGCGKGTFADMVGNIFPALAGQWDGDSSHFNEHYRKKLLFVDENPNAEKPTQYVEIKKLTGNKKIKINEKYRPEYYAPNNINVIIATNDPRPMFLKSQEQPESENVNNFFIYRCPDVASTKINNQLGEMLQQRLGNYVRTELKDRFRRLSAVQTSNNRYGLSAPITPFSKDLFVSSKTTVEMEAEELARYLVCGIYESDPYGGSNSEPIQFKPYETKDGELYVQGKEIRDLVGRLRFKGSSNYKAYITILQEAGILSIDCDFRQNRRWLGYRILREPKFYDDPDDPTPTLFK
ncbi:hypothetical protein HZB60_12360 [candidate division KSB1 bacterium]|nr:hypothetical protein [candidate division KSB1 bacterium]